MFGGAIKVIKIAIVVLIIISIYSATLGHDLLVTIFHDILELFTGSSSVHVPKG